MVEIFMLIVAVMAFVFQVFVVFCCMVAGSRFDTEMEYCLLQKNVRNEKEGKKSFATWCRKVQKRKQRRKRHTDGK